VIWVTSAGTVRAIASVDPEIANAAFASGDAIVLGGRRGAVTGRACASCERFLSDADARVIPADLQVAMYDPERWRHTPLAEQRDPVAAMGRFAERAHGLGYRVLTTPHPGLVMVEGSRFEPNVGETKEDAYVRSGIVEAAAAVSDIIETQAQRLQRDPEAYRAIVSSSVVRARESNPDVLTLSGLSTSPGYPATDGMLLEASESVADVVDGHYVSLAKGRFPEVMAAFLRAAVERSPDRPDPSEEHGSA
jgi:hypothetical protein